MAEEPRVDLPWEAGFDGDRAMVISRLGPLRRVFPKPPRYHKRFFHELVFLPIEDWQVPVPVVQLGPGCSVQATLAIRFQPTLCYARQNIAQLRRLNAHIKESCASLVLDAVELELQALEDPRWLQDGCHPIERSIENTVNELLALREIQCRSRCTLEATLGIPTEADAPGWSRYQAIHAALILRHRDLAEQWERDRQAQELRERTLQLQHAEAALELQRKEEALRRAQQLREINQLKSELATEEQRQAEQRLSETRLREEALHQEARLRALKLEIELKEQQQRIQLADDTEQRLRREIELLALEQQLKSEQANLEQRAAEQRLGEARQREEEIQHEARLRALEMETDLREQEQRARMVDDAEERLKREIEVLALERQRLLLEEEIREIKVSKAKGWVINARNRFPLSRGQEPGEVPDPQLPEPPDGAE